MSEILEAFRPFTGFSKFDLDLHSRERRGMIARYGFSIPTQEAVNFVLGHARRIVEVGAGSGYWSRALADAGGDIVATDNYAGFYGFKFGVYFPVDRMDAEQAIKAHPDRAVFMSWPTLSEDWAERAARAMQPGDLLFYIGEGHGGCCADDGFFELLDSEFEEVATCSLPSWPAMQDDAVLLYRKRAPRGVFRRRGMNLERKGQSLGLFRTHQRWPAQENRVAPPSGRRVRR